MQISSTYNRYVMTSSQNKTVSQNAQAKSSSTFGEILDKVTISGTAKGLSAARSLSENKSFVTQGVEGWHKKYIEEKNMPPDQNLDAMLPENRERMQRILEEVESIIAAEPDTINRSDEANKRLDELWAQNVVYLVFGESMVVTDEMMNEGTAAWHAVDLRYAKQEGMTIADWKDPGGGSSTNAGAITQIFLNQLFGEPGDKDDDKKQHLAAWKEEQFRT